MKKVILYRAKKGKYIQEIVNELKDIKKKAKGKITFRWVRTNNHLVNIAFFGKKIKGKHQFYVLHKIAHPLKEKVNGIIKCKVREALIEKLGRILKRGEKIIAKKYPYGRKIWLENKEPVLIYDNLKMIVASGNPSSPFGMKQVYYHKFTSKPKILGLEKGVIYKIKPKKRSLLIVGNYDLWTD